VRQTGTRFAPASTMPPPPAHIGETMVQPRTSPARPYPPARSPLHYRTATALLPKPSLCPPAHLVWQVAVVLVGRPRHEVQAAKVTACLHLPALCAHTPEFRWQHWKVGWVGASHSTRSLALSCTAPLPAQLHTPQKSRAVKSENGQSVSCKGTSLSKAMAAGQPNSSPARGQTRLQQALRDCRKGGCTRVPPDLERDQIAPT
jgi:hypothetical protein